MNGCVITYVRELVHLQVLLVHWQYPSPWGMENESVSGGGYAAQSWTMGGTGAAADLVQV